MAADTSCRNIANMITKIARFQLDHICARSLAAGLGFGNFYDFPMSCDHLQTPSSDCVFKQQNHTWKWFSKYFLKRKIDFQAMDPETRTIQLNVSSEEAQKIDLFNRTKEDYLKLTYPPYENMEQLQLVDEMLCVQEKICLVSKIQLHMTLVIVSEIVAAVDVFFHLRYTHAHDLSTLNEMVNAEPIQRFLVIELCESHKTAEHRFAKTEFEILRNQPNPSNFFRQCLKQVLSENGYEWDENVPPVPGMKEWEVLLDSQTKFGWDEKTQTYNFRDLVDSLYFERIVTQPTPQNIKGID